MGESPNLFTVRINLECTDHSVVYNSIGYLTFSDVFTFSVLIINVKMYIAVMSDKKFRGGYILLNTHGYNKDGVNK